MSPKVNPIVFRLNQNNNWKSNYIENNSKELLTYNFKDIEIRNFIYQFFKKNGLLVHNIKLQYYNNETHIFISYIGSSKLLFFLQNAHKNKKVKLKSKIISKKTYKKYIILKKNNIKFINYIKFFYRTKKTVKLKKRRVKFLKYYNNNKIFKQYKHFSTIKTNIFLKKFFYSLSSFNNNKNNIILTLSNLNNYITNFIKKNQLKKIFKKKFVQLRRYEKNSFFKEGVNVLFICLIFPNSAFLLSNYISEQLSKLKKHNFFLRFLKNTLMLLNIKTISKIKGIKIKVKGRFNEAPRARHKTFIIGKSIPLSTINAKLDYFESTSFSSSSTFGVKVWIYEK